MREHSRDCGRLQDILKYAQNVEQTVIARAVLFAVII